MSATTPATLSPLTGKLERGIYQVDSWGLEGQSITRTSLPYFLDQHSSSVRLELGGRLQTGAIRHKVLAGLDHLARAIRNQDGQRIAIAPLDLPPPPAARGDAVRPAAGGRLRRRARQRPVSAGPGGMGAMAADGRAA
ncbi:hypothetical protein F2P44_13465 [Massilia sp. CCM 8695]|uniref:Uncharacterized protein n=1 Tax=Massilia frigida TaxID=2609281 RepID=A0ABX0N4T5_9BURK|nr:hypothetical protein [Massilia frigida]NHZ80274.1 hypothetical protein [Massilia frigida]